ncbi:MAG: transcription-repair coupling factor [Clostridia bacterium]|nr:transcription-repair coupling factor [Clostridia bacterium]
MRRALRERIVTASLWSLWAEWPDFRAVVDALRKGQRELAAYGLTRPAAAMALAALWHENRRPQVVIAPDWEAARALSEDLAAWLGEDAVALFPPAEFVPYGVAAQSRELAARRLEALHRLAHGEASVAVAPVAAALRRLMPAGPWREATLTVRPGDRLEIDGLARRLVDLGYDPAETVDAPGLFARRGGLVDVYPLFGGGPYRIDFFDDEVDSVRVFDPATQKSTEACDTAVIPPAREVVASAERRARARAAVERDAARAAEQLEGGPQGEAGRRLLEYASEQAERLESEGGGAAWEAFLPYLYDESGWLGDYAGPGALFVLYEPLRVAERAAEIEQERRERYASLLADGRVLARQLEILPSWDELAARVRAGTTLLVSLFPRNPAGFQPSGAWSLAAHEIPPFRGQTALLHDEIKRWRESRYATLVCVQDADRARRLAQELEEAGVPCTPFAEPPAEWTAPPPGSVWIVPAPLAHGATISGLRVVVVGDADIAGPRPSGQRRRARAQGQPAGIKITSLEDLEVGDYVVHVHHGIGQYLGTRTMTVQGVQRDYLMLRYEGQDRLYVPTDQIDLVQKYVGGGESRPKLYKLGGNEWQRVRQRVKESVQQMARELVELYAARQALEGHAFSPDTPWQREFEAAFPYEETPDQLQAIAEVKADMERPRPMDRLLCGDVGYGKTEVAVRAAFKAVMDGKQVAVLVPTTILAEQHYLTFKERFAGFPVRVDMLSRFRSRAEQEKTITQLRTGEVDIVIGTHRLVQEDVAFKDLGLLIIDEEQRFGVAHKERLKQLRRTVDVLTLTATPIPRTLHMAMAGLRDMSVIETPPKNRYPVETYVVEYSDAIVREAIQRELARGGQVFYLHNHVKSIHRAYARLKELVPEADIVVAHGQMEERELERVMVEFLHGQHDVLLCTTIIESGLDIPNVNTLVVEDADRLGLAQLYQIRGRVGRSDRLAFAYFTFRPNKILSEAAEKRLQALKDFTELGSGLRIALRDLEIRGAGNILGPEQHGFMAQVGLEMYTELLEEAVRELRGERRVPETRASIELRVDAYLPDDYIAGSRHKLEFYKKINAIGSLEEADEVEQELVDRFGEPPAPVRNLLAMARLRVRCGDLGILAVSQDGSRVRFGFAGYMQPFMDEVQTLQSRFRRRLLVDRSTKPAVTLLLENPADPFAEIDELVAAVNELPMIQRWRSSAELPV